MSDSECIAKLRNDFIAAFNRQDVDALAELVTDDLVGMPPNQPAVVGKEASREWWSQGFKLARSRLALARSIEARATSRSPRHLTTSVSRPAPLS